MCWNMRLPIGFRYCVYFFNYRFFKKITSFFLSGMRPIYDHICSVTAPHNSNMKANIVKYITLISYIVTSLLRGDRRTFKISLMKFKAPLFFLYEISRFLLWSPIFLLRCNLLLIVFVWVSLH